MKEHLQRGTELVNSITGNEPTSNQGQCCVFIVPKSHFSPGHRDKLHFPASFH